MDNLRSVPRIKASNVTKQAYPCQPSFGTVVRNAVVAALVTITVTHLLARLLGRQRTRQHSEELLDESLVETFPASDAPATQDFKIPENRL